jgi:hypothetical protein
MKCTLTTQNYWVFGLFLSSGILENMTFRKLDMFPSSGEGGGEDTYSVGPLERANLNHRTQPFRIYLYFDEYEVNSSVNIFGKILFL